MIIENIWNIYNEIYFKLLNKMKLYFFEFLDYIKIFLN